MYRLEYTYIYRIIEYPKLEWIHKDSWVQLMAPRGTTQKSDRVSESNTQMLFELQ